MLGASESMCNWRASPPPPPPGRFPPSQEGAFIGLRDSLPWLSYLRSFGGASTCRYCIITSHGPPHVQVAEADEEEDFCRMLGQLNALTARDVLSVADGCDRREMLGRLLQLAPESVSGDPAPAPSAEELREVERLERTSIGHLGLGPGIPRNATFCWVVPWAMI